jgi:hypothetical protein
MGERWTFIGYRADACILEDCYDSQQFRNEHKIAAAVIAAQGRELLHDCAWNLFVIDCAQAAMKQHTQTMAPGRQNQSIPIGGGSDEGLNMLPLARFDLHTSACQE